MKLRHGIVYDSRQMVRQPMNTGLSTAVGVIVTDYGNHPQMGRVFDVQTERPVLHSKTWGGLQRVDSAAAAIVEANARAAQRCRELAAELIEHAEALEGDTAVRVQAALNVALMQ